MAKTSDVPVRKASAAKNDVVHLPIAAEPAALVQAIRSKHPRGWAVLYDRYASHVRGVLVRVLGKSPDIPDLLQDVFMSAVQGLSGLKEPNRLKAWLSMIAVNTARGHIRKRSRGRWLSFMSSESLPETAIEVHDSALVAKSLYGLLDKMAVEDRIVFSLRFIGGMELKEVAEASDVSLSTAKRRLLRAKKRFVSLAKRDSVLSEWASDDEGGIE